MSALQFQIDILNTFFIVAAFIISLLTLWFSHLKGSDIDLCSLPVAETEDYSKDRADQFLASDYVTSFLDLKPIHLVFVNNGSRAGAITGIEVKLEPNLHNYVYSIGIGRSVLGLAVAVSLASSFTFLLTS